MSRHLPRRPNLLQYRKQAKDLLRAYKAGDADAIVRFRAHHPHGRKLPAPAVRLSDAQWVVAREHGFESWRAFSARISAMVAENAALEHGGAAVQLNRSSSREVNLGVFLRNGARILTATEREPVRLSETSTGKLLHEFGGYTDHAWALRVTGDNRTLFVGCRDGAVRVVDLATENVTRVLTGHREFVRALDIDPGGTSAISGGMRDPVLRLWHVVPERCVHVLEGHRDGVYCVAFDGTQRRALSGSRDTTIRLWDLSRGECVAVLEGHRYHVHAVAWAADGARALSCSQDIRLWDVSGRRCVRVFEGHTETIRSVVWSPDQRFALSAAHDRTVRVWNIDTGECVRVFAGHSTGVINAVWTAEGRISSVDWNGEIRNWEL